MISLRPIDAQNWYTCCQLALSDQQQSYMEPNAISLLHSDVRTDITSTCDL